MDSAREATAAPFARSGSIRPVVLAGGAGRGLWPVSRAAFPKQLHSLAGDRTMLQETLLRTGGGAFADPVVVCGEDLRFLVADQADAVGRAPQRIVLEPQARNTAPALAVAALLAAAEDPRALLLAQPSDHRIGDSGFQEAVARAAPLAAEGHLVTFGLLPPHAAAGGGRIEAGEPLAEGCFAVAATAPAPAGGRHYGASGIYLFRADVLLAEFTRLRPALLAACRRAVAGGSDDGRFFRLDADAFAGAEDMSIADAVIAHTGLAAMVPLDAAWHELGGWPALHALEPCDGDGNAAGGDVFLDGVRGCYVRSEGPMVAALGVEGLVVVATPDAVLVAAADRCADVGRVVDRLSRADRPEATRHRRVRRPWGSYETVDAGDRFQVKRIVVDPGASLSRQMHHHRAEHWVVVRGTARVECGEATRLLGENESVYIPIGTTHRLENPGRVPLHLIEVQSGSYLGEDDIVCFDDAYGRA